MLLNCGVGEDSWESFGLQGDPTRPSYRRSVLGVHWKDWCWSWKSNTLATWCKELTHLKRPWCWEGLKAEKKGMTKDEMVGWYHQLSGHEFEWTLGVGDGQGGQACCSPWGCKELDTTERLNWSELNRHIHNSWYSLDLKYPVPLSSYVHLYTIMLDFSFSQYSQCVYFIFFIVEMGMANFQGLGREYVWEHLMISWENGLQRLSNMVEQSWSVQASVSKIDYIFLGSLESYHSFERGLMFKETEVSGSGGGKLNGTI